MDVKGNKFTSYILQPFTSAILVKDPDPSVPPVNQTPLIIISNPSKGNKYEQLASIVIEAVASDPDGTISKVEFYSGITKLVDLTSPPYSYIWKDVEAGSYSITAIATDNLNATTTSSPVEFKVEAKSNYDTNPEILNLYPNPNRGHFSIEFINALLYEKSEVIITDLAGKHVYSGSVSKENAIKQIDLSYIKSGIYLLMIIGKGMIGMIGIFMRLMYGIYILMIVYHSILLTRKFIIY